MAAPEDKTTKDLNGSWWMNKTLSDDPDPVLVLQGIGWLLRKAIGLASITLQTKQYVDPEDNLVHIDIEQIIVGGLKGTLEKRTLDWQWRPHVDHIFGEVRGRSRWIKPAEVAALEDRDGKDREFLATGWEKGIVDGGELIESYVESEKGGWIAMQTWGFEEVQIGDKKERRYTRHVIVRKGEEAKKIRLVYDWVASQ